MARFRDICLKLSGFGLTLRGFGPVLSGFGSTLSDFEPVLSDFTPTMSKFDSTLSDFPSKTHKKKKRAPRTHSSLTLQYRCFRLISNYFFNRVAFSHYGYSRLMVFCLCILHISIRNNNDNISALY